MLSILRRTITATATVTPSENSIVLPLRPQAVRIEYDPDHTLAHLRSELAKAGHTDVQFLMADGSGISSSTYFKELQETYLIKIRQEVIKVVGKHKLGPSN